MRRKHRSGRRSHKPQRQTVAYSSAFDMRIGFAHMIDDASSEKIDQLLLSEMPRDQHGQAGYSLRFPRHITSVSEVDVTADHMQELLGHRITANPADEKAVEKVKRRSLEALSAAALQVQPNRVKPLAFRIDHVIPVMGGRATAAIVDCAYVHESRSALVGSLAGAYIDAPNMREPHMTIGKAFNKETAKQLFTASEKLVGMEVSFTPVMHYVEGYAEPARASMTAFGDQTVEYTEL